jgi:hypothetical protein
MRIANWLIALFALFMLVRHWQRALRFLAPGQGQPRRPFAMSFVNALLALMLLAGTAHIALRAP